MSSLGSYLSSTIGRKQLVGIAGLGLSLFVLSHMVGNMLIFVGAEAYNKYGHALTSNPLIYIAEAGLVGIFILHLALALYLSFKNKESKGSNYAVAATRSKASYASQTMRAQGVVILGFVVLHLKTFKYGKIIDVTYGEETMRDLFALMVEVFQSPFYAFGYIAVILLLWAHLGHGFSSSLQTLGLNGEKIDPVVTKAGHVYAAVVCLGFIAQPLYVFFVY